MQYIQIHTDMHKICTRYMQNTYKIRADTCTKFKGLCSAYLYVLYVSCMYHVCILGGVHIVCICMYLYVSVCIVHMDSCCTSLAPPWYVSVCICMYLYVSVCICMYLYVLFRILITPRYISVCICMYLYVSMHMYVFECICMYLYVLYVSCLLYVSVCICMYCMYLYVFLA